MGSADYQINFKGNKTTLIAYTALQNTLRDHYTGIFPDEVSAIKKHLEDPPYGHSTTTTWQGGLQLNHELPNFFNTRNVLTVGTEYISDKVLDKIPSYHYLIDQHTRDWGTFIQSDWDFAKNFNLLSGIRMDLHNLLNRPIFSPRIALMYKFRTSTQLRFSYGTGFRAPQAFDTDLHIAFAGGGVSRVRLSPDLREERSKSFSASVNFDKAVEKWIAGFTTEVFYTRLRHAFELENTDRDDFGEVFTKKNGQGAAVRGLTLEVRANYNRIIQLETGFTLQKSNFDNPVAYLQGVEPTSTFLRTPNDYGFANLSITPGRKWNINLNCVYTGKMMLVHIGGAENFPFDQKTETRTFTELNSKISYTFHLHSLQNDIEIYGGVKNILNAYQSDFDKGKNRDSNYIYGPGMPMTILLGVKLKMD